MKYVIVLTCFFFVGYGDIIIDSSGLNKNINQSISEAKKYDNEQRKAKDRQRKIMASQRSYTNTSHTTGSNTYKCSYRCRTDGILSNHTKTFNMSINANRHSEAEDKLRGIANKHCRSKYAEGTFGKKWMWPTSMRCE